MITEKEVQRFTHRKVPVVVFEVVHPILGRLYRVENELGEPYLDSLKYFDEHDIKAEIKKELENIDTYYKELDDTSDYPPLHTLGADGLAMLYNIF